MATLTTTSTTSDEKTILVLDTGATESHGLLARIGHEQEDPALWQNTIDFQLVEWGRDPSRFDDEDVTPPTKRAVAAACRLAADMQNDGAPGPGRVVPDGDGGIVFERRSGRLLEVLTVDGEGSVEYSSYRDARLVRSCPVGNHTT